MYLIDKARAALGADNGLEIYDSTKVHKVYFTLARCRKTGFNNSSYLVLLDVSIVSHYVTFEVQGGIY